MIKKYRPFFRASAMDLMAFKMALFTWLIVTVFQVACTIFLWYSVYQNSLDAVIQGFTMKEMIVYQVYINLFTFVTFDNMTANTIFDEIKDGTIAMSFVKPISYRLRFVATNLGSFTMLALLFGLPCFTIAIAVFYAIGYIQITSAWMFILYLLLFFIAQVLATLLNDIINYIFGIFGFYTMAGFGLNQIKTVVISFLAGSFLPLSFFPGVFKNIVNYLPFAGMAQNPVLILLGKVDVVTALTKIGLSIGWLILLEFLGFLLFRQASKKVTVQGG